jgi:hypothetical protein
MDLTSWVDVESLKELLFKISMYGHVYFSQSMHFFELLNKGNLCFQMESWPEMKRIYGGLNEELRLAYISFFGSLTCPHCAFSDDGTHLMENVNTMSKDIFGHF